ncbi:uncharacterized protein LOC125475159 [Pyrus x bretschneideri]|uniref:uncharacterized protein LOC125475159 n=1 Tax=Pyrus x bretschneideri TaxID=225117 RepID=UPI00202E3091|nr:uncharacterized protein LOC125475159 [Pyrus x bretschneideri]
MPREEHVSSPAQVPLAALAQSGGEQHRENRMNRNCDTNEQDKPKSNMDWSVNTGGEAQDWFYTRSPHSIWNFNELSLAFTKEYSSYRLIKKKSDHFFNLKKDSEESLCTYVKRFKAEKAKIVGCDDSIACSAFRKGLSADYLLFEGLIMGENLSLANSFAVAEKQCLWDEEKHSQKPPEQPRKEAELTQNKVSDKPLNNKNKLENRYRDWSLAKGDIAPKMYTKFSVSINQILRDLKDKPWFKPLPPIRGNSSKMEQTKYCAFHRSSRHTTNNCTTWKRYIEQLVKEGKCDQFVDRPTARPRQEADADAEPPAKTI